MTLEYEITDTVEQNRKTRIVAIRTADHKVKPVVNTVKSIINTKWPIKDFKAILEGKGRPRLESSNDGEIYFRQRDTGEIEVRLSMATDEVREYVVKSLIENEGDKYGMTGEDYIERDFETEDPEPLEEKTMGTPNVESERQSETVDDVASPKGDDSISFIPPFRKDEVDYKTGSDIHDDGARCADCVHYAGDGQCKMVKGEIDPDAMCEDLYADLQVNGRVKDGGFKTNLIAKGDDFVQRFQSTTISDIKESITDALESRLG